MRWLGPCLLAVLTFSALSACRSRTLDTSESALPDGVAPSPAPPSVGLPVPEIEELWDPPALIAGDLDGLRRAVAGRRVFVQSPSLGLSNAGRQRASRLVEQLGATVAGIGMHHLEDAISAGSLTLERLPAAPGGPRYRFADSMLREGWDVDVGNGADAVLFLDVAPVEHEAWTALESYAIGSCEPAQRALAEGQERSLAQLEDFLDHVDALLEHAYVIHAARRLSASQAELARFAGERPAPGVDPKTHACGTAMRELLSRAACSPDRPCAAAPRVFLRDQAMIGALVDEGMPAADCAQRVGYDAVSEVVSVQREISEEVAERLDPTWSELAARAAALSTMHADLAQACTPRRRRFAEADLDEARRRMNQVIEILREDPRTASLGVWRSDVRRLALTQREEVRVFAVYDGGPASGAARAIGEVTDLREFVLEQARCSAAPDEVPLAVVVADVATDRVAHLGFHFAEELSCSELGPRSSEPSEPDAD